MPKRRKSEDSSEGESSGDDEPQSNNGSNKTPANVADDDSSSSSDDGDHEWTSAGAKKSKKSKKKNKSNNKSSSSSNKKHKGSPTGDDDDDEEREEGEIEDDDDDDKSDDDFAEEFNDGYDENLMGDEADQERLAQMTEKEREEELFNRSEKREVLRARFEIERKLRMQRKAEKSSSSSVPTIPSNLTETKTTVRRRNLEDKNTRSASLRHLKEQRDKKKAKQQRLRAADVYSSSSSDDDDDDDVTTGQGSSYVGPVGAARKSSSSSSSDTSSDDSDVDGVTRHRSNKSRHHSDEFSNDEKDDYVISLADLNSIRVTRNQMEAWCHTPFFAKTVKDAFVKMGIGAKNAKPVYRIVQILDVFEAPDVYNLNKTRTNKMIKVRYGKAEKSFRLEYISNTDFAANEFTEWKEKLEAEKIDLPKKSMIVSKQNDLAMAVNYQYTESELDSMLKEKAKFSKNPSNYAMKKTQLLKEKEHAEQMNDYVEAERIQKRLNEIEERAKELDKQRTHTIAAISFINERNRLRNIQEAEKAILAEAEKERASGTDDPFKRRKCAPQLFTLKNQKNQAQTDGNGTNGSENSVVDAANPKSNTFSDSKSNSLISTKDKGNSSPNRVDDGDLFNAHNFEIQLDFDIQTSTLPPTAPVNSTNGSVNLNVSSSSNSRRSLNLEEYKKKKGLI